MGQKVKICLRFLENEGEKAKTTSLYNVLEVFE